MFGMKVHNIIPYTYVLHSIVYNINTVNPDIILIFYSKYEVLIGALRK
jgi:hypothetical protein